MSNGADTESIGKFVACYFDPINEAELITCYGQFMKKHKDSLDGLGLGNSPTYEEVLGACMAMMPITVTRLLWASSEKWMTRALVDTIMRSYCKSFIYSRYGAPISTLITDIKTVATQYKMRPRIYWILDLWMNDFARVTPNTVFASSSWPEPTITDDEDTSDPGFVNEMVHITSLAIAKREELEVNACLSFVCKFAKRFWELPVNFAEEFLYPIMITACKTNTYCAFEWIFGNGDGSLAYEKRTTISVGASEKTRHLMFVDPELEGYARHVFPDAEYEEEHIEASKKESIMVRAKNIASVFEDDVKVVDDKLDIKTKAELLFTGRAKLKQMSWVEGKKCGLSYSIIPPAVKRPSPDDKATRFKRPISKLSKRNEDEEESDKEVVEKPILKKLKKTLQREENESESEDDKKPILQKLLLDKNKKKKERKVKEEEEEEILESPSPIPPVREITAEDFVNFFRKNK